jgi:hypothetical protein
VTVVWRKKETTQKALVLEENFPESLATELKPMQHFGMYFGQNILKILLDQPFLDPENWKQY